MLSENPISEFAISETGAADVISHDLVFTQVVTPNISMNVSVSQHLTFIEYLTKEWIKPTGNKLTFVQDINVLNGKTAYLSQRLRFVETLTPIYVHRRSLSQSLTFQHIATYDIPNKIILHGTLYFTETLSYTWKKLKHDIAQTLVFTQSLNLKSHNFEDFLNFSQSATHNWKLLNPQNTLVFTQTATPVLRILQPEFDQALTFTQSVYSNIRPIRVDQSLDFTQSVDNHQKRITVQQILAFQQNIHGYTPKNILIAQSLNLSQTVRQNLIAQSASHQLNFNQTLELKRAILISVCQCIHFDFKLKRIKEKTISQSLTFAQSIKTPLHNKLNFVQTVTTNVVWAHCCLDTYVPDKSFKQALKFHQTLNLKMSNKDTLSQALTFKQTVFYIRG